MRLSDFKARLAEDERRTQEESQDKAKKLNQYLANDPDVQVFRSKYLKLFKAIAHDCGRQANLHVEETSIPAKTTIARIAFRYKNRGIFGSLFRRTGMYCCSMSLGVVSNRGFIAVYFPEGNDLPEWNCYFKDMPKDLTVAKEWLNEKLYFRLQK